MENKEIEIKKENNVIEIPDYELNFEELKHNIDNSDFQLIAKPLSEILKFKKQMEQVKNIIKEKTKKLNEQYKKIDDYLKDDLKPRLLAYYDQTKIIHKKTKVKIIDGKPFDIEEKIIESKLPKGLVIKNLDEITYDEKLIEKLDINNKYFKKVLNKKEVKDDVKNNLIDSKVIKTTKTTTLTYNLKEIINGMKIEQKMKTNILEKDENE